MTLTLVCGLFALVLVWSMTAATYSQLSAVQIEVKSATHFWFGGARRELPLQHVGGNRRSRALADIRRQPAPTRPGTQRLAAHQPLDAMQAAGRPLGQQIVPYAPCTVGPAAGHKAGPDRPAQRLIRPGACAPWPGKPGTKAAARDAERLTGSCPGEWCRSCG